MKVAVLGIFYKEFFFTNIWQNYYGNLFGYENLYAIVEPDKDPFIRMFDEKVNLIVYNPQYHADVDSHVQVVMTYQQKLLENYDVVIFAEADEYFIPDPEKYKDLKNYLEINQQDYIRVCGYNVINIIEEEPSYNPYEKILKQRNWCYKDNSEDKMVIIRKPVLNYGHGFHASEPSVPRDENLLNFHLKLFDYRIDNARRANFVDAKNLHPNFGPNPWQPGFHQFKKDEQLKLEWYDMAFQSGIIEIPSKYRTII
jgi:hypothetical protein